MSTIEYKGYAARVEFEPEDQLFVGHIVGINDVVGFHADTVVELEAAFHEAVDDYIETCAKIGKQPDKTYSGNLMLRVSPEIHRQIALAAQFAGVSLAKLAEEILQWAMQKGPQNGSPLTKRAPPAARKLAAYAQDVSDRLGNAHQ